MNIHDRLDAVSANLDVAVNGLPGIYNLGRRQQRGQLASRRFITKGKYEVGQILVPRFRWLGTLTTEKTLTYIQERPIGEGFDEAYSRIWLPALRLRDQRVAPISDRIPDEILDVATTSYGDLITGRAIIDHETIPARSYETVEALDQIDAMVEEAGLSDMARNLTRVITERKASPYNGHYLT